MTRGFEIVKSGFRKTDAEIILPIRATAHSAGHDFYSPVEILLSPGKPTMIWTDVKAYMPEDEVLLLHVRSSMGKVPVILANGTGIIDADYYGNPGNDGNIGIMLLNLSNHLHQINIGDRIAQGIFVRYFAADGDASGERIGGFGSTDIRINQKDKLTEVALENEAVFQSVSRGVSAAKQ